MTNENDHYSRENFKLLRQAETYHQFGENRSYLNQIHKVQERFLHKKTKKIRKTIRNIGVSLHSTLLIGA